MLVRMTCCLLLLFCGLKAALPCEPVSDTEMSSLTVRLVEQAERPKQLADLTILFADNEEFRYLSGGELPAAEGETPLEFGTKLTGQLKSVDQQKFRATLKLEVGERVESDDPRTQSVRSEVIQIRTDLVRGSQKRIHCGGNRWIVLLVE